MFIKERALEMYSLEGDSELRAIIFEPVGGIETGIKFWTLLNGQVDAWTQLFKSIDNNFVHSNIGSLQVGFNGLDVHFKHITSKYIIFFISSNIFWWY